MTKRDQCWQCGRPFEDGETPAVRQFHTHVRIAGHGRGEVRTQTVVTCRERGPCEARRYRGVLVDLVALRRN